MTIYYFIQEKKKNKYMMMILVIIISAKAFISLIPDGDRVNEMALQVEANLFLFIPFKAMNTKFLILRILMSSNKFI